MDNCPAQNKNWVLFTCMLNIVNCCPNIVQITLKFLERGHTFMRADSIHGIIGKSLKKTQIYNFPHLLDKIENCGENIQVMAQSLDNIIKWDRPDKIKSEKFRISFVKIAQFRKGYRGLFYKYSFSDHQFSTIEYLIPEYKFEIPTLLLPLRGVNKDKKSEILKMLVPIMPPEFREFWNTIPESNEPDLCSNSVI